MSDPYVRAAHRGAIFEELVRLLREDYSAEEGPIKKTLIVRGRIFIEDQQVTDASVQTVISDLLKLQKEEEDTLRKYAFRREDGDEQKAPVQVRKQQGAKQGGGAATKAQPGARRSAAGARRRS